MKLRGLVPFVFQVCAIVLTAEFVTDAYLVDKGYEPLDMSPANLMLVFIFMEVFDVYFGEDQDNVSKFLNAGVMFVIVWGCLKLDTNYIHGFYASLSDTMQSTALVGSAGLLMMSVRLHMMTLKFAIADRRTLIN